MGAFSKIGNISLSRIVLGLSLVATAGWLLIAPRAQALTNVAVPRAVDDLSSVSFVAFDVETTGFSYKYQRIVELAAVKFRNGRIVSKRSWLINPKKRIGAGAQRVHGISYDMIKDSPTFAEIYPEFLKYVEGCVLMAHNARFDVNFMRAEIERINEPLPKNRVLDSLPLFRRWYPEAKKYSLASLAKYNRISGGTYHRALADSVYLAHIFKKGVKERPEVVELGDIYRNSGGSFRF